MKASIRHFCSFLKRSRICLPLVLLLCLAGFWLLQSANPRQDSPHGPQPYVVQVAKGQSTRFLLNLDYAAGENTVLNVEPEEGCVTHALVRPLSPADRPWEDLNQPSFCDIATLDLSGHLKPGMNVLALDITSAPDPTGTGETTVYIGPVLFGTHPLSSFACLVILAASAFLLLHLAVRAGMNLGSCILLLAGLSYYVPLLHFRPNLAYSNDLPGHLTYIRYMAEHFFTPYAYDGWEHFHPPFYYFLAARFFNLFNIAGIDSPLTGARVLGLILYMTFCFFALRTLHDAVEKKGLAYYAAGIFIVFWPLATIFATRISNDLGIFAGWGASFCYLARWFKDRRLSSLQLSLVWLGFTFLMKSNALVLAGVVGAAMLYALLTRRLHWRELLQGRSLLAFAALGLGVLGNTGRIIYMRLFHGEDVSGLYLSPGANETHPLHYFLNFSPADYLANPVVTFDKEPGYLNYFLKTMLYGEQQLGGLTTLPTLLNLLLLVLLVIIAASAVLTLVRRSRPVAELAPYLIAVVWPPVAPFLYMLYKRYMFCQSFRFILPIVAAYGVLFVYGMETSSRTLPGRIFYWLSIFVSLAFSLGAILLNVWLYSHGQWG